MTFSDLCRLINPFLRGRCKSKADLFDFLILNIIDPNRKALADEVSRLSAKQKRNIVDGKSSISKLAEKLYPSMDVSNLCDALQDEVKLIGEYAETFGCYDKSINKDNFAEETAEILKQIILDNSALFRSAQLEGTATLRSQLFEEAGGVCPVCGRPLDLDSTKENAIVAIGLDGFSPSKADKAIGLCRKCAELHRNGQIDKDLSLVKERQEEMASLRNCAGNINIDEALATAIDSLLRSGCAEKVKFNMKSLKVEQKIDEKDNYILCNKVKMNVATYFSLLYGFFGKMDGEEHRSYDMLSASVRVAFLQAEKESQNKEYIFNFLTEQVSKAATCEKSVAEIIASYFVQSCEVFHEISE